LEEFKAGGERQLEALEAEAKRNPLKKDDRGLRLQESGTTKGQHRLLPLERASERHR
jgi:hypothetical protein